MYYSVYGGNSHMGFIWKIIIYDNLAAILYCVWLFIMWWYLLCVEPALVAKSNIILDVKPWDDETGKVNESPKEVIIIIIIIIKTFFIPLLL